MRRSPSIIPDVANGDVYLVLDDFGRLGRSWRETDEQSSDRTVVVQDLLEGQYNNPVLVVAFNTAEGWSRDVSEEIAEEIAQACADAHKEIPTGLEDFGEACPICNHRDQTTSRPCRMAPIFRLRKIIDEFCLPTRSSAFRAVHESPCRAGSCDGNDDCHWPLAFHRNEAEKSSDEVVRRFYSPRRRAFSVSGDERGRQRGSIIGEEGHRSGRSPQAGGYFPNGKR